MKIETARLHAFRAADDLDVCAARGQHPDLTARARVRGTQHHAADLTRP
jgi:hypothetical protein